MTPEEAAAAAGTFRHLAGRQGVPEVIHSAADALPGSTTAHVVYDLGVAIGLAFGDLAQSLAGPELPAASPGRA